MDRSILEGTFAQWEAFFRACKIPPERSQSHAEKFVDEFVRPHELSTYTKDDYRELGVKQGDRKAIENYLRSPMVNGHPPQFADQKPIVRPISASDDDITVLEPAPTIALQSREPEQKSNTSKRNGFSAACARRSFLSRSATAPPTSIRRILETPSTSAANSNKPAASSTTQRPAIQSPNDAGNGVTDAVQDVAQTFAARIDLPPPTNTNLQSKSSRCSGTLNASSSKCRQNDALAVTASAVPPFAVSCATTNARSVSGSDSLWASSDLSSRDAHQLTAQLTVNSRLPHGCQQIVCAPSPAQIVDAPAFGELETAEYETFVVVDDFEQEPVEQVIDVDSNDVGQEPTIEEISDFAGPPEVATSEDQNNAMEADHPIATTRINEAALCSPESSSTGRVSVAIRDGDSDSDSDSVGHKEGAEENHQQPTSNSARSKLHSLAHAENSLHELMIGESTTSVKNGKVRFSRRTAAARRSTAPPPMEMSHEDEFPPVDLNEDNNPENVIVEGAPADNDDSCHDDIDHAPLQMEWEEMKPMAIETREDEPSEAFPPSATLTNRGTDHSTLAKQVSHQDAAGLSMRPRSSKAISTKEICHQALRREMSSTESMDFDDGVAPAGSEPREGDAGVGSRESPERRREMKSHPRRSLQDSRDRSTTSQDGHKTNPSCHYKCDTCGRLYDIRRKLAHRRICGAPTVKAEKVNTAKCHKCDVCGKECPGRSHLDIHMRKHTGEMPFACDKCPKSYKVRHQLTQHKRVHTGERPYKCDECGLTFSQKRYLTVHERKHTGEKPYQCKECPKRFKDTGTLSLHRRMHTGAKPYVCNICGKAYAYSSHFHFHMRRAHPGVNPYACKECLLDFATLTSLTSHKCKQSGE